MPPNPRTIRLRDLYKEISVCLLQSTGTPTITYFKFNTELSPCTVVGSMHNTKFGLLFSRSELGQCNGLGLEVLLTSTETVALFGTGAQDGHLDFHTVPEF